MYSRHIKCQNAADKAERSLDARSIVDRDGSIRLQHAYRRTCQFQE